MAYTVLTFKAALQICVDHQGREAARMIVASLDCAHEVSAAAFNKLVDEQLALFAGALIYCVAQAMTAAGRAKILTSRKRRGDALRRLRKALKVNRQGLVRDWELVRPHIDLEIAEALAAMLSEEETLALVKEETRDFYAEKFARLGSKITVTGGRELKLSLLLKSYATPPRHLVPGLEAILHLAETSVSAGAPNKDLLGLSLVLQLSQFFEGTLGKKAAWTEGGPFARFCNDVFLALGLQSKNGVGWEHLLRTGIGHHRSSVVWRQLHQTLDTGAPQRPRLKGQDNPER